jgi:SPP1 family predicted phage head-tail adaptor
MLQSRIRRGELDKQVSFIERIIQSSDSNEDYEGGWQLIATDHSPFARIKQLPAKDVMIADRITNVMRTELVIDYRDDITDQMRFVYKTRPYDIISITEHEESRDRYLLIVGTIVDTEIFT